MLYRQIILEWGQDTESGVWGLGYSPDNGKNFYVLNTTHGRKYRAEDGNRLYPYISDQVQDKIETVVAPAKSAADSAVAYANNAIENSRVNSQAIADINSAVSDAASDAAVARSDGLRAWNAAQSNVNLIDLNYASASASISSARTEAIAAADEAKASASAAKAGVVAVKSDVAAVQADVTATKSDVAVAKSDIADTKTTLEQTASGLNSKISGVATSLADTASALSDAKMELSSDVAETKKLANNAQTTADSAVKSAGENAKALTSQANALSDAKKAMDSDVASAKGLANAAQATADNAIKSASSVANDLAAVASQAKSNANGITKVTSDVGLLQATVADNSGNISKIQETATQIQQAVSDNSGAIVVAKQTADSAATVASDAKSNATVAVQTASGASVTAKNAQGDATTAMVTAKGAVTQASDAKSNATIAVQTASEASLTATNAQGDASVAKQTASDASVQIKNAQGDISKLQTRAGTIEASVTNNSGAIADVQATANQLKVSVSDNAGNITVAKQTADSAVTVASDARSNATVAIQTASQASITAKNASGQAASAVFTANGAMTTASNAKSDATVAVQTASGASLTATNAKSDATVAKQTASEASLTASNAKSDFAQLSIRANKIEANVANNSGAIASVQQTANGLTTTVADIKANGGGVNLLCNSIGKLQPNNSRIDNWTTYSATVYMKQGQQYTVHANASDGLVWSGTHNPNVASNNVVLWLIDYAKVWQIISDAKTGTMTTFTWNNPSGNYYLRVNTYNPDNSGYVEKVMLEEGTVAHTWSPAPDDLQNQFTQTKQTIDGITTTINDPKTGLNATYQTAAGNATTISNVKGDVSQLKVSASSASVALSDAVGNISSLKATASELETKYADAAGDINKLKIDAKGTAQTLTDAQGDIAKLKIRADGFDTEFADTKGNISKLQTDATGTTQTLANTKSDVAVLQSRADGLDAKYADAAGDINTLKANASGFSQTLVSAKGDISTLKVTATGFKNTLTDAQGNISTLQSDVAGLKKTTSDHAGNISTLQADAKTLTSQMSSAQGDISTLKQTVSGFSSKVSGMETSLANANSKINDIKANGGGRNLWIGSKSFANSNVNFPEVDWNTDSDGMVTAHITGIARGAGFYGKWQYIYANSTDPFAVGDSETFSVEMKGTGTITIGREGNFYKEIPLTTTWTRYSVSGEVKYTNSAHTIYNVSGKDCDAYVRLPMVEKGTVAHDWSPAPEDNDAKITANTTAIEQNKQAIALKADQTTVDKTNGTVQQLQSQLKVQAGQIASKVSSSDLDAKGYATQTYTQTQIKQTSDSWNTNLASVKDGLTQSYTNLHSTVDGIQTQVYNSDGSSKITQLSNLIATKVSQGDYNSQITQLKNDINLRVAKGDVISQINQEAGGNTLIQVSNGKKSLILDAGNTIVTGKAWIPSAAIANLTANDIKTGTLTGSTVHLDDGNGNTIDLGALSTNYVGFHSKATNGDQTYIDSNGIHNYGATYDTRISQGKITTNLLAVNGGGLIDFRSGGSGATLSNQELQFYNSSSINGGLSFSGSVPIASTSNDAPGNELRIRYDRSFAVTPINDDSVRICASPSAMQMGFVQSGSSTPERNTTGLWVDNDSRHFNLGVWATDSTWTRIEANQHNIHMQANDAHAWLSGGNNVFRIYRDNDGGSATATKLQVDGWAWVKGWVEAAGHSQHSTLSSKTRIEEADPNHMLDLVNNTELTTFAFKSEVAEGTEARHIGPIIDDVNDVAQYRMPAEFIAPTKTARDDDNMIGALFGAVQALTKRIKTLEDKLNG
ncbi:hypothetical protein QSU93_06960 [Limosilactobacillus fermentum]|uniref:hypothetical protein n=1 Tax=Limosilactobacillus fermentum TaxID=1613 RepID=UPI0025700AA8|nr:hypothetical protein [Limosilactobacillus fermentum]WJD84214.1 hypothetical protein QSU93_06960 [Limosilactobacillus fermentum]